MVTDLRAHLLALEEELQTAATRSSEARLRELLEPDFQEFGRSGRHYDLRQILENLTAETAAVKTAIDDFTLMPLSETIMLATYLGRRFQDDGTTLFTNRSSIWRLGPDGQWRMAFHQGTPTARPEGD